MHKITMYEGIIDKIDAEMETINKAGINNSNLDQLYKLAMSLKAVDKHIECLEDKKMMEEEGESYRGRSYARHRNAMGQYSRDGWNLRRIPDYSYDGMSNARRTYSRDNAKLKMVNKLETLMDDTMSEHERNAIRNCINDINMTS